MSDPLETADRPTPVLKRPALEFTIPGVIYCCMMLFMGLAAMNTQANLLFGVFGLMIGILIVSGIISRIVLRKLRVARKLPKHGVVGEALPFFYEVTNGKRYWPSLSLSLAELDGVNGFVAQPQCYVLHAAPRMTATVPLEIVPRRRGVQEFHRYQISTSFPFGFVKRAIIARHKDTICIFPAIAEVDRRVLAMCRSADNVGESSRPRAGGSDEFYGVREFIAGDNPRNIYWRRSARTGVLVAKEMTRVSPPRLLLLVDTYLPDPSPELAALVERVIAMAASVAVEGLRQELAVGICVWSEQWLALPPTRGKQQREELLTTLARLPVNRSFDAFALLEKAEWMIKGGTTLIMITSREFKPRRADVDQRGLLVLSATSETTRSWFKFRPGVSFSAPPAVA